MSEIDNQRPTRTFNVRHIPWDEHLCYGDQWCSCPTCSKPRTVRVVTVDRRERP